MDILQAIVLGIVQGLGEFLPISSTAHLVLVPYFFGWEDPGLAFDVALHAGTLVAVIGFFWKDWLSILNLAIQKITNLPAGRQGYKLQITNKFQISNNQNLKNEYSDKFLLFLIVATIPGFLAGYFFESYAEDSLRHPLIIAFTLSFVGIILYLADKFLKHKKEITEITVWDSVMIGIFQAIAIIPGVSRSGATMTAGLLAGLSREGAARFSFLLSMPIILGAILANLPDFFNGTFETIPLLVGILTSAISGYFAIAFLLKFIQRVGFVPFVVYRIVLAGLILVTYFWF